MNEVNDTPTMLVAMPHSPHLEREFSKLQDKWRATYNSVRRGWHLGKADLAKTISWLKKRSAALHRDQRVYDVFTFNDPLDELWRVLLMDATPGTRTWAGMWKKKPNMQRLTINDLLIAFAAVKLDRAEAQLMRLTYPIAEDDAGGITPEFTLCLAEGHIRDAEEALRVANGAPAQKNL